MYEIGDLLKLDGSYYIVHKLSTVSGCPIEIWKSNEYGIVTETKAITNRNEKGWNELPWVKVKKVDISHIKYINIIRKIDQLQNKFKARQELKLNGIPF